MHEDINAEQPPPVNGNEFKKGVRVNVFGSEIVETLGESLGLREVASTAIVVRQAVRDIYKAYIRERDARPGQVPVVEVRTFKSVKMKNGTGYGPVFNIIGWVDRRPEFADAAGGEPSPPSTSQPKAGDGQASSNVAALNTAEAKGIFEERVGDSI